VERYLAIERVRFGDRLLVEVDVEPAALDAAVPNLLLQPLVENALKHGIAPRPDGGRVAVRARAAGAVLRVEVCDDGGDLAGREARRARARAGQHARPLERLYGGRATLRVGGHAGGTSAVVELPLRAWAAAPAALAG
jgi:two-component system sensor histidine kinase AlgZ